MTDLSFRAGPFQVCDNGYKLDFKLKVKISQLCLTLCNPIDYTVHGNSPDQNTGVGSRSFLQGIFPTKRLNPGLQHCRPILHQLSHQGSPRILEWVAYPFSSGSSRPRNRTRISCIASGFFTSWTTMEFQISNYCWYNYYRICKYTLM